MKLSSKPKRISKNKKFDLQRLLMFLVLCSFTVIIAVILLTIQLNLIGQAVSPVQVLYQQEIICTQEWICAQWSSCHQGMQQRSCAIVRTCLDTGASIQKNIGPLNERRCGGL
ncbi:MAG TPA: hypothetical protein VJH88_04075 [Candidatus Nanoarchaeia archaeon]|nr:hypothetical protein [Candidatus Nanoarchaeia archaeon]